MKQFYTFYTERLHFGKFLIGSISICNFLNFLLLTMHQLTVDYIPYLPQGKRDSKLLMTEIRPTFSEMDDAYANISFVIVKGGL